MYQLVIMPLKIKRGFSLPEVMISMLLGTLVMAISLQVFSNSEKTASITSALTKIASEATNAMNLFGINIEQAGYFSNLNFLDSGSRFPADGDFKEGQVVFLYPPDAKGNSSIIFRLEGDDNVPGARIPVYDCLGNEVPAGEIVTMMMKVDDNRNLVCHREGKPDEAIIYAGNVESLVMRVGLDKNLDQKIDQWKAEGPDMPTSIHRVLGVELDFIIRSEDKELFEAKKQKFERIRGKAAKFEDKYMRKQFKGMFRLKNRVT